MEGNAVIVVNYETFVLLMSFIYKQAGAPTLPSAIFRKSMNLKTFGVTDMSKSPIVSQCVTFVSFLNWLFLCVLGFLVNMYGYSVTHVTEVTLVTYVTRVTDIKVMCLGHQMCHRQSFRDQFQ
jgi:hypothetical protein